MPCPQLNQLLGRREKSPLVKAERFVGEEELICFFRSDSLEKADCAEHFSLFSSPFLILAAQEGFIPTCSCTLLVGTGAAVAFAKQD